MPNYYTYTALAGDTFDSIALDFYNQESLSSTIIQANPLYRNVLIFSGGEQLKVPIIEQQAAASLPPWKKAST
ncbi:LysM domain-containing protein [Ferviditalea candida]|uniref:Phage tail protein n=1 Tax=Ferviditalea candida TaxID=3108399 RepID=A0ABU5ZLE2_9BACL|nr:phage tail protein [Paenibacillaceae bacterium T2]